MHFLFDHIARFIQTWGYWAVLFGLLGENAGLPLPGETILIFASFLAYKGEHLHLHWIIVVGICAATMGDNIGYLIGRGGGRPLLEKWKSIFHVSDDAIRVGEDFLNRRGALAIFVARFIAGLRIIAGPVAGVLRMPWRKFVLANAAGAVVWVSVISGASYTFGSSFESAIGAFKKAEIAVAVALAVFWFFWRRHRKRILRSR